MAINKRIFWTNIIFFILLPLALALFAALVAKLSYETIAGGVIGGAIGAVYGIGIDRISKMKEKNKD